MPMSFGDRPIPDVEQHETADLIHADLVLSKELLLLKDQPIVLA